MFLCSLFFRSRTALTQPSPPPPVSTLDSWRSSSPPSPSSRTSPRLAISSLNSCMLACTLELISMFLVSTSVLMELMSFSRVSLRDLASSSIHWQMFSSILCIFSSNFLLIGSCPSAFGFSTFFRFLSVFSSFLSWNEIWVSKVY